MVLDLWNAAVMSLRASVVVDLTMEVVTVVSVPRDTTTTPHVNVRTSSVCLSVRLSRPFAVSSWHCPIVSVNEYKRSY